MMVNQNSKTRMVGLKTAIIIRAIINMSMKGFGEYVTIRMRNVMDELKVRDSDRKKYIAAFAIAIKLLEPCIVYKIGYRNNRKYVFKRECLWRLVDLTNDFGD